MLRRVAASGALVRAPRFARVSRRSLGGVYTVGATPPRKFPGAEGCSSDEDAADSAEIEILDNFFDAATQEEILRLMERPKWSFTGGRIPNQFWHMDGLEAEPFFRQKLFSRICKSLGQEYDVVRIYANGQTATQHGSPHTDDGDFTFLYYPNPRWKTSWGGALHFFDDDGATVHAVDYKPNRAVFFPADLVHAAEAPSAEFPGLRVSLAYKLKLRE